MSPPTSTQFNHLIQAYGVCTLILFLKYTFSLFFAASKENHPEEDAMLKIPEDSGDVKRKTRQFANDMENIPFHMAIFYGALFIQCLSNASGNGKVATLALTGLIIIYTISRVMFTICYIFKLQPFRSLLFFFAILSVAATAALATYSAFKVSTNDVFPQIEYL